LKVKSNEDGSLDIRNIANDTDATPIVQRYKLREAAELKRDGASELIVAEAPETQ